MRSCPLVHTIGPFRPLNSLAVRASLGVRTEIHVFSSFFTHRIGRFVSCSLHVPAASIVGSGLVHACQREKERKDREESRPHIRALENISY